MASKSSNDRGFLDAGTPVPHRLFVRRLAHFPLRLLQFGVVDRLVDAAMSRRFRRPPAPAPDQPRQQHPEPRQAGGEDHTSKFRTNFAFSSMNLRRGSTSSPISVSNSCDASNASSIVTLSSVRRAGSIVVSRSWSGFISPRPL